MCLLSKVQTDRCWLKQLQDVIEENGLRVVGTPKKANLKKTVADLSPNISPLSNSSEKSVELLESPTKVVKIDKHVRREKCVSILNAPLLKPFCHPCSISRQI